MPAPEFQFGMTLTGEASDSASVLPEVFRAVLAFAGVKGEASERLLDEVMTERRNSNGRAAASYRLQFTAHAGEIEISFAQEGRSFRTTCPVPIR